MPLSPREELSGRGSSTACYLVNAAYLALLNPDNFSNL
jgi:hypothetical protein